MKLPCKLCRSMVEADPSAPDHLCDYCSKAAAALDPPKLRRHRDDIVRLHYGPAHGRIVTLTESAARSGYYLVPVRKPIPVWLATDSPMMDSPYEVVTYRRETLGIYDDVDHAFDYYDYWIAEGEPLPKVGRAR